MDVPDGRVIPDESSGHHRLAEVQDRLHGRMKDMEDAADLFLIADELFMPRTERVLRVRKKYFFFLAHFGSRLNQSVRY